MSGRGPVCACGNECDGDFGTCDDCQRTSLEAKVRQAIILARETDGTDRHPDRAAYSEGEIVAIVVDGKRLDDVIGSRPKAATP